MENTAAGTPIAIISVVDADGAEFDTHTFAVDNAEWTVVDGNVLTLNFSPDYEQSQESVLTITATDVDYVGSSSVNTFSEEFIFAVLDENDEVPKDITFDTSPIFNECDSTTTFTVSFIDADTVNDFSFDLVYGSDAGAGVENFEFVAADGALDATGLRTAGSLRLTSALDYDALDTHSWNMALAISDGVATVEYAFPVSLEDCNDRLPELTLADAAVTLPENSDIGALVTSFSHPADSLEASEVYTYTLSSTDGSFNANDVFVIDGNSIKTQVGFDYETDDKLDYLLSVECNDGLFDTFETLTVSISDVNDNAPANIDGCVASFAESDDIVEVCSITFTDADSVDTHNLLLLSDVFEIVGMTVQTKGPMDYDTLTQKDYTLHLEVSDGVHSTPATFEMSLTDVNDQAPTVLDLSGDQAEEHIAVGTLVGTFTWTDTDTVNENSITLSGDAASAFEMQGSDLVVAADLDYESQESYQGILEISDGVFGEFLDIVIYVSNINDHPPSTPENSCEPMGCKGESTTVEIPESTPAGSLMSTISWSDLDIPPTSDFTATVEPSSMFQLSRISDQGTNGFYFVDLLSSVDFDYETTTSYEVTVVVSDAEYTTEHHFLIEIVNEDDELPTDILLNGVPVGCDGVKFSDLVFDDCGVCGGDGTACVVSMSYGGSTGYLNDWDDELNYACGGIYGLFSVHDNGKEDRLWAVECITGGLPIAWTSWSGTVNDWDDVLDYTCPQNQIVTGLNSWHDNGKEDREWNIQCGVLGATYASITGGWSGNLNDWDDALDYSCPSGQVIGGLYSSHHNHYEDRIWQVKCNTIYRTGYVEE
jgi:hypothetical protein